MKGPAAITWPDGTNVSVHLDAGYRITPEAYVFDLVALENWARVREEARRG